MHSMSANSSNLNVYTHLLLRSVLHVPPGVHHWRDNGKEGDLHHSHGHSGCSCYNMTMCTGSACNRANQSSPGGKHPDRSRAQTVHLQPAPQICWHQVRTRKMPAHQFTCNWWNPSILRIIKQKACHRGLWGHANFTHPRVRRCCAMYTNAGNGHDSVQTAYSAGNRTFGTLRLWPMSFSMCCTATSILGAMNSMVGPPSDKLKVLSFCAPLDRNRNAKSSLCTPQWRRSSLHSSHFTQCACAVHACMQCTSDQ
jgi:hypothetical protein